MRYCTFMSALALFTISLGADATGTEGKALKDDYDALRSRQGLWTKFTGKGMLELHFKSKEFPKLEVTITNLVPEGKGFAPEASFKVVATLREKDGKRVLVIDGNAITYGFKQDRDFLILNGAIEHKKKRINLTGNWGSTNVK